MQQLKQAHAAQQAYAAEARKAAREEFASRQRQAMRNKAAAEGQLGIGSPYNPPAPALEHAGDPDLARRRAYAADGGAAAYDPHRRPSADPGVPPPAANKFVAGLPQKAKH